MKFLVSRDVGFVSSTITIQLINDTKYEVFNKEAEIVGSGQDFQVL